jgi:hypothetical protein
MPTGEAYEVSLDMSFLGVVIQFSFYILDKS